MNPMQFSADVENAFTKLLDNDNNIRSLSEVKLSQICKYIPSQSPSVHPYLYATSPITIKQITS